MANVTTNNLPDADALGWDTRTQLTSPADGALAVTNNAGTSFFRLVAEAANTLAVRNGTNPQALRLYNTYTDGSNYERGVFYWSSNALYLASESAGSGASRSLNIQAPSNVQILTAGGVALSVGETRITVRKDVAFVLPASIALFENNQLGIERTSNTSLTFRLRGSDGVTRSASLTLA